ncbi:MAG TPA: aminopeptidase P family N-terminal domain-containing protein, partial [Clostridia bacterium]|nr:aminopeptidase P family N-terminal domain-containing protein [Clostridia bacterium]
MVQQRTEQLLRLLSEAGAQGAVIHKPSNIRYLSGYSGEGLLLLTPTRRAIITDFRYTEQAERQAPS